MSVSLEVDLQEGNAGQNMKRTQSIPFAWSVIILIVGQFMASGSWDISRADKLEDACKERCRQVAEEQSKQKGGLPAAQAFGACMDACKRAASVKSEADIPDYCKASCEDALKRMNHAGNAAELKECVTRCMEIATKKLRQGQQQQK
jgi:hypothetical protein